MADIQIAGVTLSGDALTQDNVEEAFDFVREVCGWHIAPSQTETLTLDVYGSQRVNLPSLHVTDVSQVLLDGVDITSLVSWSQNGMLDFGKRYYSRPRYAEGFRRLQVTLTHGFDKMPAGVRAVVRQSATASDAPSQEVTTGPFTFKTSGNERGGSVGLTNAAKAALDRYVLPAVKR